MFNALFLSLDSLVGCLGLGLLNSSQRTRAQLCLLFGFCDGLGTVVGSYVGRSVPAWATNKYAEFAATGVCVWFLVGALLIYAVVTKKLTTRISIYLVPVFLSADNLIAGVAHRPDGDWAAVEVALSSIACASVGFGLAELSRKRLSPASTVRLGTGLLLTALVLSCL